MKDTPLELIVSDRGRVSITFDGKVIPATSVEIIQASDSFNNHAVITIPMKIIRVGSPSSNGRTAPFEGINSGSNPEGETIFMEWKGSIQGNGWLPHPENVVCVLLRDGSKHSFGDTNFVYRWDWITNHHKSHSESDIVAYQVGVR